MKYYAIAWINKDPNIRRNFMLDHIQDLIMFPEKTSN